MMMMIMKPLFNCHKILLHYSTVPGLSLDLKVGA